MVSVRASKVSRILVMCLLWLKVRAGRIAAFFFIDRCLWAVSREDSGDVRKGVEFFSDGVEELLMVPSGEVGATNIAIKEGVTGKEV